MINCHWIDPKWQLRSMVLEFCRFPTKHTGDAAKGQFWEVIQDWNLQDRICAITTDNSSNMFSGTSGLHILINNETSKIAP